MSVALLTRIFATARGDHFVFSPVRGRRRAKSFALVPGGQAGTSMAMKLPEPVRSIVTNEATLLGWFETARSGERFTYHVGHLATDRARETSGLAGAAREMLGRMADRVMTLVGQDQLIAVQRRLDDGRMAYLAVKASARSKDGARTMNRQSALADTARTNGEASWR